MIELDFRNIIVLISLAIHTLLLWILFRYGRKSPGGREYAVATLAVAGWILPMVFYRAHIFNEVELWARILYIMASFTSPTFFYFSLVFPDKRLLFRGRRTIPWWIKLFLAGETLLIVLLCIHPTWLIRGITLVAQGEDIILWGPLYFLYALHITLFFVAAFIILFRKLDKITGLVRKQTIYILSGYFCASSLAMVTNLILPWVGYFELNWLGQFFSTIAAAFTTYAILKHRLLNIKLIATEGFVLFLNLFLFIQLFLSTSGVKFVVNSIILAAVLIVSSLLVTSVRKEAQRLEEITELARSLEASNLRLQELDKQKTEFLSIASHQLRTPLSILSGYIELIKEGAYGKVRRPLAVVLRNMDESNNRLVTLVDEFLNITRIEQGTVKFDFKKQDLTHVIESVIEELEKRAEQKEVKIIWNKPDQPVLVSFDEEKIRHVVFNYLDNAIKYTEEGKITIAVKEDHDGVSFRVFDTGIGFNRTDQVNFFQKFYRGENVRGTNVNGTGLGLYVCSKFIEAHHGQVWASSQGLGKGAEFGFSIPFKQP
jgi:signal transduction histidine kinase